MNNLKKNVNMILALISKSSFLKLCFGYSTSLWFGSLLAPQNSEISGFIETILNAVPSKIAGYLGVLYGLAIVFKKVSEVWKAHHLNRYEIKMAKENFQQKEIETDKQRNENG